MWMAVRHLKALYRVKGYTALWSQLGLCTLLSLWNQKGVTIGNRDVFGPCRSQAHVLMIKWYSSDVVWPYFAPNYVIQLKNKTKQKKNRLMCNFVRGWVWRTTKRFKVEMFLLVRCSRLSSAKKLRSLEMHGLFTRKLLGKSKASVSMHRCRPCSSWERLWHRAETLALLCLSGRMST